jgi:hypothetical protein
MISPEEPFLQPIRPRWMPPEMLYAPALDPDAAGAEPQLYYALLINPFYPKDANASFGKHVLTPTWRSPASPPPRQSHGVWNIGTRICCMGVLHIVRCRRSLASRFT